MHIGMNLLVLTDRSPGGTGHHAISLFEALVEASGRDASNVTVTGFANSDAAQYFSPQARQRLCLLPPGRGWPRIINELIRLPLAARRAGVGIMVNPAFFGVPWGGRRCALIIHDLYFRSEPALVPPARRLLLKAIVPLLGRNSDWIFAVSRATKAQIEAYYPAMGRKTAVLHSGNRVLSRNAPPRANPLGRPYLLLVGHMTANKSPGILLSALAAIRAAGRDMTVVHIGDEAGRLGPLADAAGVADSVVLLGRQPDDVLAAYYAHCEALVIPSIREGFGLPLIEAQAQGAPVVASSCDALIEIGGTSALFFPIDDIEACTAAILTLLDDPVGRRELIARGYENAANFRWDRTAAQLLEALRNGSDQRVTARRRISEA